MIRNSHRWGRIAVATVVAVGLAAVPASVAGGDAATPQRPSLSTNAATVSEGRFELETGATVSEGAGALPLFAKYGVTDAIELAVGMDAIRWVDGPGDGATSVGDVALGARWRLPWTKSRARFAVAGFVKVPTAGDDAGTGEVDASVTGIASIPFDSGVALDLNVVGWALGDPDGGTRGQVQAIATLGAPIDERWSSFLEVAWQRTAGGGGDGGFVDAGVAYAATPAAVFDLAAGAGWSDGYPDWSITAGWTVLFP